MDDNSEGYSMNGEYVAKHFYFAGWFATPKTDAHYELFFLHELYECVKNEYPNGLSEFLEKCKTLRMIGYIDEYKKASEKIV